VIAVALPEPVPGLIIRYSYLWYREHLEGRDEGQKDRPCAIIAAIRADENGDTRVLVLPITHSPPDHASLAVEIPAKVKARLGLDDTRSWVVLSEWNEFIWPGPDLRRLPAAPDSSVAYGMIPPGLFATIRERFLAIVNARNAHQVPRT
jgi:glyoxylase-like metal-dependent hydrolase (beta-lactamase superfamily II)